MADHVVQLARDPRPLLHHGRVALALEGHGTRLQHVDLEAHRADSATDHQRREHPAGVDTGIGRSAPPAAAAAKIAAVAPPPTIAISRSEPCAATEYAATPGATNDTRTSPVGSPAATAAGKTSVVKSATGNGATTRHASGTVVANPAASVGPSSSTSARTASTSAAAQNTAASAISGACGLLT